MFFDEIGELPAATRAKLRRVQEQRELLRVGALKTHAIDVRFIAATHRDLEAVVAAGRLREDLYFRLAGVTVSDFGFARSSENERGGSNHGSQ